MAWQGRARLAWRGLARLGQPKERKKIFRKETTCTSTTVPLDGDPGPWGASLGKNVQPNDGLARRDERDKGVGCNNPTTLHVRTKRTGAHIMRTLEEVLDWLDTQLQAPESCPPHQGGRVNAISSVDSTTRKGSS